MLENRIRGLFYIAGLLYIHDTPDSPRGFKDADRNTKNVIKQVIAKLKGISADKGTKDFPSKLIKTLALVYAIDAKRVKANNAQNV